ncbi:MULTISPECIES: choline sulfate utilization transcriptional regulator [Alphaproteobacteria]|uniref:LysR family transcriptional regulator n=2 Tax=Alphaproteobacteria TaxID=28211 RepID=A0A512HGG5_9HYPH|nr:MULTISPECIES: LysR family transcriptional regulator [Alphaproteobacteria]GEO84545.1 LysR family transcriptional regulator [Ciceribacter naphthalenivorans]GLR22508.1 LysR family transcriptional regulator [Ciceribacter naphthalenivorans]GLT05364.1 LysR family transcriptional regulator [Sphingomonas psychrolutea]
MAETPIDLGWMRLLVEISRRGSLSAAARVLGLSQPAVSYQIRQLEQAFGIPLLRRLHRGVAVTDEGRRLCDIAERTVSEVDELERSIRAGIRRPVIRLCTDYAFSSLWLIPRMQAFRQSHPDLELQIVATQRLAHHWEEDADIAVAFGSRGEFGQDGVLLMPERVVPICTPAFLERHGPFEASGALSAIPLIHLDAVAPSPWFEWSTYLPETGTGRKAEAVLGDMSFNTYAMVIQAALCGQGVALGWLGVVDQLLDSGLLCRAGPVLEGPERGYWLLAPRSRNTRIGQLAAWLVTEVSGSSAAVDPKAPVFPEGKQD